MLALRLRCGVDCESGEVKGEYQTREKVFVLVEWSCGSSHQYGRLEMRDGGINECINLVYDRKEERMIKKSC